MKFTHRSLVTMFLLTIFTFGIYTIYWFATTRGELNAAGADIPTTWLFIVPIANFFYLYKFAEGFCTVILRSEQQKLAYFLVSVIVPIGPLVYQSEINKRA